jgi:hypothetical protein
MNIPIYRAKTIKQDYNEWEECEQLKKIDGSWYAIGFYDCKREIKTYLGDWEITHLILIRKSTAISEISTAEIIDISTLSINFEDMLDSQGNKIFASLQEDGKGGDIVDTTIGLRQNFITICLSSGVCVFTSDTSAIKNTPCNFILDYKHRGIKVVGIQE